MFFLILMTLMINLDQSNLETSTAQKFQEKNIYQISDSLIEEKEVQFFQEKANYDILHHFSTSLEKSTDFDYYNAIWQPMEVVDFKGDAVFGPYYEMGDEEQSFEMNGKSYSAVKSMRFNQKVFELNDLQLASGKGFEDEAYIFREGQETVPIILGSDYTAFYKIGDQIEFAYYGKTFIGTVVGFFRPFQTIIVGDGPEIQLNRYMILPVVHFAERPTHMLQENMKDELFYRATLLTNANGNMITKHSPLELREIVDRITQETGFAEFSIIGANGISTDLLFNMKKQNQSLLYVITFLLFLMMTVVFIFTVYLKIKKSVDTYLVLLISGLHLKDIYNIIRYEYLLTMMIGSILPIGLLLYLTKGSAIMLINYVFILAVFIAVMILPIQIMTKKTLERIDIIQRLKG